MKGMMIYEGLTHIDDTFILGSMPPAATPAKAPRFGALSRFLSSGVGAAVISGIVALGVLTAIVLAGRTPPDLPPAITDDPPPVTESTEEESERETEPMTEPVTEESIDLQNLLRRLENDGHDLEAEYFHGEGARYAYTATVGGRIFSHGDTLEVTLEDLISYGEVPDALWHYEHGLLKILLTVYGDETAILAEATSEDGLHYTLTLPEGLGSGAFTVELLFYEVYINLCPIVVYSADIPMAEYEITSPPPDETREPAVYEDEALNAVIQGLREEGQNMEQLTFRYESADPALSYTATVNDRVFYHRDVLEITLTNVRQNGNLLRLSTCAGSGKLSLCLRNESRQVHLLLSILHEDERTFTCRISLPDDLEADVYTLSLHLDSDVFYDICPIVVAKNPIPPPSAPTVYEDEALNQTINGLRDQGYDMEALAICKYDSRFYFGYSVVLNRRVLRPGDTFTLDAVYLARHFQVLLPENWQDWTWDGEGVFWLQMYENRNGEKEYHTIKLRTEDGVHFTATIPEDAVPGVYWLKFDVTGDLTVDICPMVMYTPASD